LEKYDLIDSNYKIISNDSFHDKKKLTTSNILEGFVVYDKYFFNIIKITFLGQLRIIFRLICDC
jgi:hypothetical protein